MEEDAVPPTPAAHPIVDRQTTAPFLIRTFVKLSPFHRLTLFEENALPTTDEHQLFTWKDATLREVLTTLRLAAPSVPEYHHPLARFAFRTVYADPGARGRFAAKDLGSIAGRDILGEPGDLKSVAEVLLRDEAADANGAGEKEKQERTLDELRFVPGDYLLVSVTLPKTGGPPGTAGAAELAIKGSGAAWRSSAPGGAGAPRGGGGGGGGGDGGWGGSVSAGAGRGAGTGHWRGSSDAPPPFSGRSGRGGGGGRGRERGGDFSTRERDLSIERERSDRRPPPPARNRSRSRSPIPASRRSPPPHRPRRGGGGDSPPPRRDSPPHRRGGGGGGRGRGGRGANGNGRRGGSRSRSRSPPRRRRYD